ncbi:MAG: YhhA family cyclophane-containing RiPP [Methylovirgula sp.]|uniref:YhhA family cyclophane-containing RiPP n=1 Tax=Methylovirgula sp. TaxID=1978224 RepID=UPI0030765B16
MDTNLGLDVAAKESVAPDIHDRERLEVLDSVTLSRLMEEVRNSPVEPSAYNRTHNRHNRT